MKPIAVFKSGKDGGSGSFLCPPGHPNHTYSVYTWRDEWHKDHKRNDPDGIGSVDWAAKDEQLSEATRQRAQELLDNAELKCSEAWLRQVYGYFRNMYLPESGSRNVGELINDKTGGLPAERHAAVAMIREYFPDHAPRLDLIADPGAGYGSHKCAKCGQHVQYEAKWDAFATFGHGPECPSGGQHE